jgi:hypothetical protein
MIFPKFMRGRSVGPVVAVAALVLTFAGCASQDVDDLTGSHMQPLPLGADNKPAPPIEAGDIAIAGQLFSHDVRNLPQVASLTTPQLVRFNGVTSLVTDKNHQLAPIDTAPYTQLLRDRLLLGDREKLRFVEHTLPPFGSAVKHHDTAPEESGDADFEVRAELRGHDDASALRVQIEFIDIHSGAVLVNGIYRIRQEAATSANMSDLSGPPPEDQDQGQAPLPNSAHTSGYGNNGWTTPVPAVGDPAPPPGKYNF